MARLNAQHAGFSGCALLLFASIFHVREISARLFPLAGHLGGRDIRGNGGFASSSGLFQTHAEAKPGHLDFTTLRRGNIYAINVGGDNTFLLLRVDVALLQQSHNPLTAASLTAALRADHPAENVGWAWFADTYQEDGWYRLEIRIDEDAPFPDVVKARAAGFVEGNLQGPHMYRYWTNYRVNEYRGRGEAPSQELYAWLDEQYEWMLRHVQRATGWTPEMLRGLAAPPTVVTASGRTAGLHYPDPDPKRDPGSMGVSDDGGGVVGSVDRRYWMLVGLVAAQFEGLAAGFWASVTDSERNMTWHELYALNAVGDLYELNVLFPPSAEPPPPTKAGSTAASEAGVGPQRHYTPGHGEVGEYGYGELLDCSAIIKLDLRSGTGDENDDDHDSSVGADGDGTPRFGSESGFGRADSLQGAADQDPRKGKISKRRNLQQKSPSSSSSSSSNVSHLPIQNFWASHNTWRPYYDMVRTWKVYDLPWASSGPVTVSSSPGLLHSKDDWYTTDQFVVMETTNGIYNKQLYDLIQPKCVLMWQRAQVANFGAREGSEWVDLFGRENSGTYNNQWMVLDVDRLHRPRSDVLWVLEQIPGRTISKDVTKVLLEQGYWASYNVPYFPEIYNLTGYPQPSIYSTCSRAQIFSREQPRLSSRADVMTLMRLNRYVDDPLSYGLPNNAIAARYDLVGTPEPDGRVRNWTRRAYGAVDAKVVDLESFRARRTYVINGPTADDQPVFRWSSEPLFDTIRHEGCVDEFDFDWLAYEAVVGPLLHGTDSRNGDVGGGGGGGDGFVGTAIHKGAQGGIDVSNGAGGLGTAVVL